MFSQRVTEVATSIIRILFYQLSLREKEQFSPKVIENRHGSEPHMHGPEPAPAVPGAEAGRRDRVTSPVASVSSWPQPSWL